MCQADGGTSNGKEREAARSLTLEKRSFPEEPLLLPEPNASSQQAASSCMNVNHRFCRERPVVGQHRLTEALAPTLAAVL